jgi:type IV secretory pathway TraG/TraD family ATPase VirD4
LEDCYAFISSSPQSREQSQDAKWRAESFCWQILVQMGQRKDMEHEASLLAAYWIHEFCELSDKPRSIIVTMVTNVFSKFMHEINPLVCGETTISPDDCLRGKVVVLDMPVLKWREVGVFFQVIFKQLVQRAVLRRDLKESPLPVVIWQDEAQFFATSNDALTQTVSRQSKLISVILTQTLPQLYAELGGTEKARMEGESLLSNHMTKILCANSDHTTNQYMSQMLGESFHLFMSGNMENGGYNPLDDMLNLPGKGSSGFGEHWHPDFPSANFSRLAKGGKDNEFQVEAVCFMAGRVFNATGRTWIKTRFRQNFD